VVHGQREPENTNQQQTAPREGCSRPTQNTDVAAWQVTSAAASRLKFPAIRIAEIAQRIHSIEHLRQVDECLVRRKVGFDDQVTCLLGCFDDVAARQDSHSAYQSEQVDECGVSDVSLTSASAWSLDASSMKLL